MTLAMFRLLPWMMVIGLTHLLAGAPTQTPPLPSSTAPITFNALPPAGRITVTVSPTNVTFKTGTAFHFTPTITNTYSADLGINWYVNGVLNGDSTNGLMHYGNYNAPTNIPPINPIQITVASTVDPRATATSWVTLTNAILTPPPGSITVSISPTNISLPTGAAFHFNSTITNTFSPDIGVKWSVNDVAEGDSTNGLIHYGNFAAPTNLPPINPVKVTIASTVDPRVTASAWVTVTNPIYTPPPGSITVSISPTNISLPTGAAFHFNSTITNTFSSDIGVNWYVNDVLDGDSTNGLIHFGNFNAPTNLPPINPVKITIASTLDTNVSASAWVTITNPILTPPPGSIVLSVTPTNVSFLPGTAFHFTSTITNTFNLITDVKWSVNGVVDGDSTNGLIHYGNYNAPSTIPLINPIKIQVASTVDPTVVATAWVTLTNLPPPPPVTLTLSPTNSTLKLGSTIQYSRVLSNTANWGLTWTVNGIPGGNTNVGTVVNNLYTSPLLMPESQVVTLVATSQADPTVSATATVNFQFPSPKITSTTPSPIPFGNQTVILTGTGLVPQTVIKDAFGKVLSSTWLSPTQISVTANFPPTLARFTSFQAANPNPYLTLSQWFNVPTVSAGTNLSFLAVGRILEQASWGPNATSVDHLQTVGFGTWWNEQLAAVPSTYFHNTNYPYDLSAIQIEFVSNALTGMDQLRQRVAFALSGFIVVSGLKEGTGDKFAPYYDILSKDALGSYKTLLTDIALCPSMAMYLDMADNDKANATLGSVPNENFARELMQLFSVGPVLLNPDGTFPVDSNGAQIPLYTQDVITQMAKVFTGWTYSGTPNPVTGHSVRNFNGIMQAVEQNHDTNSKTILGGVVLPAGQTARQDLDATIATLVNHPNCAPFVAFRLIQHLVTGSPTPAYVQRVATVFNQTQGDLSAVVLAILTDTEARQGDDPLYVPSTNSGHLREPVLFALSSIRALGAQPPPGWLLARFTATMGQSLFYPPSVFGYYYPYYRTDAGLIDPEFQTLSQPSSLYRINFVDSLVKTGLNGYANVPLNSYIPLAFDSNASVRAIANQFFYGQLPTDISSVIQTAFAGGPAGAASIYNSIYLALTSNYYQVQH